MKVAVLYAHSWGLAAADYVGVETVKLILKPWDREIYKEGVFQMHPEYAGGLRQQGFETEAGMVLPTTAVTLSKDSRRPRGTRLA